MRIPLREGRLLNQSDNQRVNQSDETLWVVINEAAAHAYWADRSPIGTFARFSGPNGSRLEVIGVVGNVRNNGLNKPPEPEIYISAPVLTVNPMNVVVRSD